MTKKPNFKGSLNDLINDMKEETPELKAARPKSAKGLREGLNRFSIVLPVALLDDLRAVAYWNQLTVKEVISQFLESGLERYKEKHGEIKPIPNKETKLI